MNIVLIVIDSLRAGSLATHGGSGPPTPFFEQLAHETMNFRRAYATECWTLPSHASMFTGQMPSEHGAHFQHMGLRPGAPTIAELLSAQEYRTELVTRNFVFDGTIPGIVRGFDAHHRVVAARRGLHPFALFLAMAKPRFRRHVQRTGFFHPRHRESREFLAAFARALIPADGAALDRVLQRMVDHRERRQPYFLFCNLYDVHAPYPPSEESLLEPFTSLQGCMENLMFPWVLSRLGAHTYLRPGFRLSERGRRMLVRRYERAIALADAKLASFYARSTAAGLLDDTLLIVTSDHGEAFGDHDLYLHDASVYDTHLHVPLWIRHPGRRAETVEDVVSTRDLFGLMRAVGLGTSLEQTILDADYRARHRIALAEHFFYPHAADAQPRYRQNLAAAVGQRTKAIVRREGLSLYDLAADPAETAPTGQPLEVFAAACRADGATPTAVNRAIEHLTRWNSASQAATAA